MPSYDRLGMMPEQAQEPRRSRLHYLWLLLGITPVIRLAWDQFLPDSWHLLYRGILYWAASAAAIFCFKDQLPRIMPLRKTTRILCGLMAAALAILLVPTILKSQEIEFLPAIAILLVGSCVLAPILEESLFRGILPNLLKSRLHFALASFTSAILFAALHPDLTRFAFYFMIAIGFQLALWAFQCLLVPILLHALVNITMIYLQVEAI